MRILVTGAAGFVGRALVERLAGHHVFALVRPGTDVAVAEAIAMDLSCPLDEKALPSKIDGVVHLAQAGKTPPSPYDGADAFAVHVAATAALVSWAARAGASRFCLVSTGTVYEPYSTVPLAETDFVSPTSQYGSTKLAGELLLRPYEKLLAPSVLRLFFPYGPRQVGRLIPSLVRRIESEAAVELPPHGEGLILTPTYVYDIAEVVIAALEEGWSGTYNVAAPEAITLHALADKIAQALGRSVIFKRTTAASDRKIVPDLSRLSNVWDLSHFTSIDRGIARTIRL